MHRSFFGAMLLFALPTAQAAAVSSSAPAAKADRTVSSVPIATYCPRPLHRATRLIVVTVPDMASVKATLHTFERRSPAERTWLRAGPPETAVVGTSGVGWSDPYVYLSKKDEPIKHEGDNRTPAGIFRVSGPFGFDASKLAGYRRLSAGNSFCVDDPTSMHYGKIVGKRLAQSVKSSEDMSSEPALKSGMIVDYPPRRGAKAGSCIFIQAWQNDTTGTKSRIGLAAERINVLQKWSAQGFTAIAIVSEKAAPRFKNCLPLNAATSAYEQRAAMPEPHPRRAKDQRAELKR